MSEAVLGWQVVIFLTILLSGRFHKSIVAFWVIWTIVQIFALWLSILQFITIFFASYLAAKMYGNDSSNDAVKSHEKVEQYLYSQDYPDLERATRWAEVMEEHYIRNTSHKLNPLYNKQKAIDRRVDELCAEFKSMDSKKKQEFIEELEPYIEKLASYL